MSFIKYGDGQIVSIVEDENLSEEQKKSVKDKKHVIKQSDASNPEDKNKSGR